MIEQTLQTEPGRLSQSALWERQQDFFLREGAGIWTRNLIPRYITTNAFIAGAYAEVVSAYLEDCRDNGLHPASSEAFIVELGAGSGQFSFHFLQHFAGLNKELMPTVRFRYVMTDISQSTIDYWQAHEQLRPFVNAGVLDFARFDACRDDELQLLVSGNRLGSGSVSGPLIFIANYVFDSLPQDAFEVRGSELYECLTESDAETLLPHTNENAPHNEHVAMSYSERACPPNFYRRDDWDDILRGYAANVRDGAFLFPVGALRCLETLGEISDGRFMLLTADKGFHRAESFARQRPPSLVRHAGCFSLDVNFHALAEQVRREGGSVLHRSHDASHLKVLAFVHGLHDKRRTEKVFARHMIDFAPDDFYNMMSDAMRNVRSMSLEAITSLLRLSRFDSTVLVNCYERLVEILPIAREPERQAFYEAMRLVEERWFRVDPEENPYFFLGTLAGSIEKDHEAIAYYRRAQTLCDSAGAEHNLGLSYLMLGDLETGASCFTRAHALDERMTEASLLSEKIKFWPQADTAGGERFRQLEHAPSIEESLRHPDIVLEPLLPHHAEAFLEHATPEILGLTRLPAFQNMEEVRHWIRTLTSESRDYSFAITHRTHGFAGVISLLKVDDKVGRFFFWVGEPFMNQGYATASMCRLLRFAVDSLLLDELFTSVLPHNGRSARLLLRLGFRRVDVADEKLHYYYNGVNRLTDGETTEHVQRLLGGSDTPNIIVKHVMLKGD
ncbi:MAG TPA: SAM-dependent methyltransferase [Pyrinomonadaceae bacterium]|nr:SAM-dependent methyltransferase [Pyrinomonadaceae bacterium]